MERRLFEQSKEFTGRIMSRSEGFHYQDEFSTLKRDHIHTPINNKRNNVDYLDNEQRIMNHNFKEDIVNNINPSNDYPENYIKQNEDRNRVDKVDTNCTFSKENIDEERGEFRRKSKQKDSSQSIVTNQSRNENFVKPQTPNSRFAETVADTDTKFSISVIKEEKDSILKRNNVIPTHDSEIDKSHNEYKLTVEPAHNNPLEK